jgi:hypothetical protein
VGGHYSRKIENGSSIEPPKTNQNRIWKGVPERLDWDQMQKAKISKSNWL